MLSREELQAQGQSTNNSSGNGGFNITSLEYVGALSDFTGEIGRLAVMHAGRRDYAAVREVHQAQLVLCNAVTRLSGNRFGKKLEAMQTNLRKVGDVLYELSMLQRSGRATRTKPAAGGGAAPADSKQGGAGGEDAAEEN